MDQYPEDAAVWDARALECAEKVRAHHSWQHTHADAAPCSKEAMHGAESQMAMWDDLGRTTRDIVARGGFGALWDPSAREEVPRVGAGPALCWVGLHADAPDFRAHTHPTFPPYRPSADSLFARTSSSRKSDASSSAGAGSACNGRPTPPTRSLGSWRTPSPTPTGRVTSLASSCCSHGLTRPPRVPTNPDLACFFLPFLLRRDVCRTRQLEESHADDLAMAALIDGEGIERAAFFARRYFDHFLARWSSLHPLVTAVRARYGCAWTVLRTARTPGSRDTCPLGICVRVRVRARAGCCKGCSSPWRWKSLPTCGRAGRAARRARCTASLSSGVGGSPPSITTSGERWRVCARRRIGPCRGGDRETGPGVAARIAAGRGTMS